MSQHAPQPSLDELRASGAHRFDPVRFHFIETLQRRADHQRESVATLLDEKKRAALGSYLADMAQAAEEAEMAAKFIESQFPAEAEQARAHQARSEFRELERLLSRLRCTSPSSALQELGTALQARRDQDNVARPELESTRQFRDSLARRKGTRLVKHALLHAPTEPGPLNPQMLAIRSLQVMRELSPAYLNRFIAYIDTLLWLQQSAEKNR